jgi:inosose dehydratase
MTVRLATGPVSWGVDFADARDNPPWPLVLDEIARSGFRHLELGPVGYLPEDPARLRSALAERGLAVSASFVFQPLHDRDRLDDVLAATHRTCKAIAAAGGRHLVVIDLVSTERAATAGDSDAARRLTESEWGLLVDSVRAVATVASDEYGLEPVFHPHAGSYVEFADEIERLLDALPPEVIGLCPDTGHCAYAGIDPVALYSRHAGRIPYLHLKDVDPRIRRRALADGMGFWDAMAAGIFCTLGTGCVDFGGLARALDARGFDGWATVEQDRDPRGTGHPLADAVASRRFLEDIGLSGISTTKVSM